MNNFEDYIFGMSFGMKCCYVIGSDIMVVSYYYRQSIIGSFVDFSDDCFFVFEFNCYWIFF